MFCVFDNHPFLPTSHCEVRRKVSLICVLPRRLAPRQNVKSDSMIQLTFIDISRIEFDQKLTAVYCHQTFFP